MAADTLRPYVEELLAVHGFPGLAVAVTNREGLLASESFGLANIDAGTPVGRETYFEFGSIGKTFTSVLLLQLRDEELVDLDAPLTRYLPWVEVRSEHEPIAIRHLLTHTSGLMVGADMSSDSRFDVWALRDTETGFAPGSRYLYSNVAFRALGFVVEELTGVRYAEALQERVLDPIGLRAVVPELTSAGRRRLAVAYERLYDDRPSRRTDPWVPAPWLETGTGDGAQAGTIEDLASFLRVLLNEGKGLLSPEAFDVMTTPAIEADDGWWYGCGLELRGREIRHGGSMPGFGATMLGDLDSGLGVAVAVNSTDEGDRTEGIAEAILALYRDGEAPHVPDVLAVEDVAGYAGVYTGASGTLTVTVEGEHLFLDGKPLEPRRDDAFLADRPDLALYLLGFRRDDGQIVAAVHGADVYLREGVAATAEGDPPEEWRAFPGHYRAYNPWYSNFRVVLRGPELLVVFPWGLELQLTPLPSGGFRVGEAWTAEWISFGPVVDGAALRASFSGESYYRLPSREP